MRVEEQRLFRWLMNFYDPTVRPVWNASQVITIGLGLTLNNIFKMHEKKESLSINAWLEHEWIDQRIHWTPDNFGGIVSITVPARYLWVPDIVLYNNAQDFQDNRRSFNVVVYNNGVHFWSPSVKFLSSCPLDITLFPFDTQKCLLIFRSWTYSNEQVNLVKRATDVVKDVYMDFGEWDLMDTAIEREVKRFADRFNESFAEIIFTLTIRRRTRFYVYNIIIPCIMLSVLTLVQFWLPSESGEKVTLGLTVFVAYSVFSFNNGENMPETSNVAPLIVIYITCIMALSALSVFMSVVVLNLQYHFTHSDSTVPPWVKLLVFKILAPLVRFNQNDYLSRRTASNPGRMISQTMHMLLSYASKLTNQKEAKKSAPIEKLRKTFSVKKKRPDRVGKFENFKFPLFQPPSEISVGSGIECCESSLTATENVIQISPRCMNIERESKSGWMDIKRSFTLKNGRVLARSDKFRRSCDGDFQRISNVCDEQGMAQNVQVGRQKFSASKSILKKQTNDDIEVFSLPEKKIEYQKASNNFEEISSNKTTVWNKQNNDRNVAFKIDRAKTSYPKSKLSKSVKRRNALPRNESFCLSENLEQLIERAGMLQERANRLIKDYHIDYDAQSNGIEWQNVARVLDRVFFILVAGMTVIVTVVMLTIGYANR